MKIAQLVPPWLSVPPKGYGGTETIVHYLTEGLVRKGHDVTLFATGDSKTSAKLSYIFDKQLGNSGPVKNDSFHPMLHYIDCFEKAGEFDIIHNHAQYYAMFLSDLVKTPVVHTLHGSFSKEYTAEEKIHVLERFRNHNFISISNSQRFDLRELNYIDTVYNGTNVEEFTFVGSPENHLVWFGRIAEKKGPLEAIKVSHRLNMQLVLSGSVEDSDADFYNNQVLPLCDNTLIIHKLEVPFEQKSEILGPGFATLFPILWEEPFGLVMIESMACGTPIIAYNRGSVSEIIKDGVTGFIVDPDDQERPGKGSWIIKSKGIEGLCEAVEKMKSLSKEQYAIMRETCRKHVEESFSVSKMVDSYERVYNSLISTVRN